MTSYTIYPVAVYAVSNIHWWRSVQSYSWVQLLWDGCSKWSTWHAMIVRDPMLKRWVCCAGHWMWIFSSCDKDNSQRRTVEPVLSDHLNKWHGQDWPPIGRGHILTLVSVRLSRPKTQMAGNHLCFRSVMVMLTGDMASCPNLSGTHVFYSWYCKVRWRDIKLYPNKIDCQVSCAEGSPASPTPCCRVPITSFVERQNETVT